MRLIATVDPSASLPAVEAALIAEGATVVDRMERLHLLTVEVADGLLERLGQIEGVRALSREGALWAHPSAAPGSSWRSPLWDAAG